MAVVVSVILIFLGIAILVFIHVCIVGRALRSGEFENETTTTTRGRGNNNGDASLRKHDLDKLPCFEYNMAVEEPKGSSPVDCAVCLGKFEMGDKCRLLPICKHSFHANCVDQWLLLTPICPICRTSTLQSLESCGGEGNNVSTVPPLN